MQPGGILETVLYAADLDAIERFYADVLEMQPFSKLAGRQLFYRCGSQVLLIFNPAATVKLPPPPALPVPPHGAVGPGACLLSGECGRDRTLARNCLKPKALRSKQTFIWPASGGRSIYFRDPAGNCLEFAEPRIWGLQ